jgi:indolepyruvate decarboxylase
VYIELPRDMVAVDVDEVPEPAPPRFDPDALDACVDEILERLASAKSPALLIDVEVRRYGLEAKTAELARRLGLPVVTCFMGRGLLADADAPLLGTYLGVAGSPEITRLVESSDGLFLLGVIVSDTNFAVSERAIDLRRTIQALDGRVSIGYHTYSDIPIAALVDRLLERTAPSARRFEVARPDYPRGLVADDSPIAPNDVATMINDLMAERGKMPIASDIGDCLFTAMDIEHTRFVAPGYYATMGFGVPAGLGVQAATGERPLILVGDGAFQMTGWELGNCRRYGWDPIVLLFNNASWEMLRTFQPESHFNDLDDWGFASMAAGMGGDGERVTTRRQMKDALDRALARRGRFQLIEIMIPRGVLSNTLQRFVEGVKRLNASK